MAEYEHRDNSFSAFFNRDKRNDRSPDFSGKLKIDGKLYFIDFWEKEIQRGDNAGDKMFSGTVKAMDSQGGSRGGSSRGDSGRGDSGRGESRGGRDDRDGGRDSRDGYQRGRDEGRGRDQGGRSGGGRMNDVIDDDIPF